MKITLPADFEIYHPDKKDEKLTLLIYPWDTSMPSSLGLPRPALSFPVVYDGRELTASVSADLKLPNTSAVFAVEYSYSLQPAGSPIAMKFKTMICRTGLVRFKNGLPAELLVLQLPEPQKFDLSELTAFLKSGGNIWVGMVPAQEALTVKDNRVVIHIYLTGFIGNLSGNARLYLTLGPAYVPDPGKYLAIELEKTEGIGLDKGAFEKGIRNDILPAVRETGNKQISEAIDKNIGPLDNVAELYSANRAMTRARGLILNNFKLGMTVVSSAYITYPIAYPAD